MRIVVSQFVANAGKSSSRRRRLAACAISAKILHSLVYLDVAAIDGTDVPFDVFVARRMSRIYRAFVDDVSCVYRTAHRWPTVTELVEAVSRIN